MRIEHGFFIPDSDNCRNLAGLVKHMAQKVFEDFECIFCEHTKHIAFKAYGDAQNHMKDMGHCMINLDFFGEFKQHYDFTADNMRFIEKYFEKVVENIEEGVVEYRPKKDLLNIHYKINEDGEVEDWLDMDEQEDDEDSTDKVDPADSELKASDSSFKEIGSNLSNSYKYTKAKIGDQILDLKSDYHFKNFMIENAQKTAIGELILPNKKLIGNKDFALYYNQNYPSSFLFNSERLLGILQDKGVIKTSDALVTYSHQQLRKLYLATVHSQKYNNGVEVIALNKMTEKFHKEKNLLKVKRDMKSDSRHNTVFSKHYRERNVAFN